MNTKLLIATAAIAATAALATATAAKADPYVGFSIGFNDFGPGFDHGFDHGGDRFWHRHDGFRRDFYPAPVVNYGIGCGAGANIVHYAGFNGVRPVNCVGPVYTYEAWKRGTLFDVNVSASGRIVRVTQAF